MSNTPTNAVKVFIISDNYPQFEAICNKYKEELSPHKPERLTAPTQLANYDKDNLEIWDIRLLSVSVVKKGLEPFVME